MVRLLVLLVLVTSSLPAAILADDDDAAAFCDELDGILDDAGSFDHMVAPYQPPLVAPGSYRDAGVVLTQFHSTTSMSYGQRDLLEFLGSHRSDFIEELDPEAYDALLSRIGERLNGYSQNYRSMSCPASETAKYRSVDGSCNNLLYPGWGMSGEPLRRLLPAHYDDDKKEPRVATDGLDLSSTRVISVAVTAESELLTLDYTALNHHFGQLVSHDQNQVAVQAGTCSNCTKSDLCLPIPIDPTDPVFGPLNRVCLEFTRSVGGPSNQGEKPLIYDQPNRITSFMDASFLYGSNKDKLNELRIPRDPEGQMRFTPNPVPGGKEFLPPDDNLGSCAGRTDTISCGLAGDARAAEQVGLTALHTTWLREHNRLGRELFAINPHWDPEKVFQEARRLVIAEYQHIVYNEFVPVTLGPYLTRDYDLEVEPILPGSKAYRYDKTLDPSITNVYATAAFRHGHSQIPSTLWRMDGAYQRLEDIQMKRAFFNATHLFNVEQGGPDSVVRGMLIQPLNKVDRSFSPSVSKQLFEDPEQPGFGMDLIAINLQRGRDHGLAPYVYYRNLCNLGLISNWDQARDALGAEITGRLQSVYYSVEDIDAFVGMFSEPHARGALVGPTLACLIGKQFQSLKFGDRFWYDNSAGPQKFSNVQREEIRTARMARILCDNLDGMIEIQPYVFVAIDEDCPAGGTGCYQTPPNQMVNCDDTSVIPRMNLQRWVAAPGSHNWRAG